MTAAHTPGPWLIHDKCTLHMNDREVARVGEYLKVVTHTGHVESKIADARLIAAAPGLLAACIGARTSLTMVAQALGEQCPPYVVDALNDLDAAIAAARGGA